MNSETMNGAQTGAGRDWTTLALDPFHDYVKAVAGMPDETLVPSFTRLHVQSFDISSTASSGDNIRIAFNGLHGPGSGVWLYDPDFNSAASAGNTKTIYPIHATLAPSGSDPTYYGLGTTTTSLGGVGTTTDNVVPGRLISLGLEVHNTTASLYKAGTISVCHSPGMAEKRLIQYTTPAANIPWFGSGYLMSPLPSSKAVQSASPSYLEWEAAKGVYVVGRMSRPAKPTSSASNNVNSGGGVTAITKPRAVVLREVRDAAGSSMYQYVPYGTVTTNVLTIGNSTAPHVNSGFQPFSVFLTGLSPSSTFRITVKSYVEYFPDYNTPLELAVAVTSPPYDPSAFVVYQRTLANLPAGVPVNMNPKGEYWTMVKKAGMIAGKLALKAAPIVLNAAGMPVAAGAATVVGQLVQGAQRRKSKKPKTSNSSSKANIKRR